MLFRSVLAQRLHRFVDGFHISRAMKALREYLAAPLQFEPALASTAQTSRVTTT